MKLDMSLLADAFPLVMAENEEWVKIICITGGEAWEKSLAAMGLKPGIKVQVYPPCSKEMGMIVSHEGRRIALGKALIHKIMVVLAPDK